MINGNRTKSGRKRSPRDFYETPYELAQESLFRFADDEDYVFDSKSIVLDPGCGNGVWGHALCKSFISVPYIVGVDLEIPAIDLDIWYEEFTQKDFLEYPIPEYKFDLVMGNPPFSLAEPFVRHSMEFLTNDGYLLFFFRLSFLEGIKRSRNLFAEFPIKRVYVCSRRPSFYSTSENKHTTDTLAYAVFLWQKGWIGKTELDYLDWEYSK